LYIKFAGLAGGDFFRHLVTFINGEKQHTVTLGSDMTAVLEPSFLKDGEAVEILLETHNAKTDRLVVSSNPEEDGYFIEPLKLIYVGINRVAMGWLQKMETDNKLINRRIDGLEAELSEFKDKGVPLIAE
jgi:hypothetical protein